MKTIIAGTRTIDDASKLEDALSDIDWDITEVVSGTAEGVDQLGEGWADENDIPVARCRPDWEKHGRSAGPLRNHQMAQYADAMVAVWDGESAGTKDMIEKAESEGLETHVHIVDD